MKRDLKALSSEYFDVLVVGGGIHGVLAAWDASLRGLSVALIDRADFGSGTSQNSLKIIHGGLRYLRDGNIKRVRMMASERSTWMRIAPHIVHPLGCLTPTYPGLSKSRLLMSVALKLNDLISYDRNRIPDQEKFIEDGEILSPAQLAGLLPGLNVRGMTGAALWYDAQLHNSERLLISCVLSASLEGAVVANYVEATNLVCSGHAVTGVKAKDMLSGQAFEIRSRIVINSTGAWSDYLLKDLNNHTVKQRFIPSVAINLITPQLWKDYAVGLPSKPEQHSNRSQIFFIVPWQQYTLIGTWHLPWSNSIDTFKATEALIQAFIDNVNSTNTSLSLSIDDIKHVHWGFLPMNGSDIDIGEVKLVREGRVVDHQVEDSLGGLITIIGVKYTTARLVAEQAVNLAVQKLGVKAKPCQTHSVQVWGGKIDHFEDFLARALAKIPGVLSPETIRHLVYNFGSNYTSILAYVEHEPQLSERITECLPTIKAEIVHAVRNEMAQTLADVVQRRTALGSAGPPDYSTLLTCAKLMGAELGWDDFRILRSVEELLEAYSSSIWR